MDTLTVVSVDLPGNDAASVTLRCEKAEVVTFCWPCDLKVGDIVENRLSVLEADVLAAYLSDWPDDEKDAHIWVPSMRHGIYDSYDVRRHIASILRRKYSLEIVKDVLQLVGGYS
jgi:hypothetical protein